MIDHFRADANLHLELDARMESDEATKRRRQRSAGDLLHHAESHPARKARCGEAITGYFLKLQQTTRITEQHFTVIGEPDTARRAPEQWTLGLDCVKLSRSAARWKPPQSATATKARNSSKSSMLTDLSVYPRTRPVSRLGGR
jgi:hypothetical protein